MIENDVAAIRPRLFGLAYRMLGTQADADDVVQEAFVRWQSAERSSIRDPQAWLVTTTTRAAIDRLRALQRERERYIGPWLPEPIVRDPSSDPARHAEIAEDLSVAFLCVLERLAPDERAALLLHDVFGYSHGEIGTILHRRDTAVRQMVHRARSRVLAERPRFTVDRDAAAALVERFVRAIESGDEAELTSVLAHDVTHVADGGGVVAATRQPVTGREKVVRLLLGLRAKYWGETRFDRADVGGAPGLLVRDEAGEPRAIIALRSDGDVITSLHVVVEPGKVVHSMSGSPASGDSNRRDSS
jgi:RNA polymerase sigma-70 factor (ECF subfamily)